MPTPHGEIEVSWSIGDAEFELTARLPRVVQAQIVMPVPADEFTELEITGEDFSERAVKDGRWIIQLQPEGYLHAVLKKTRTRSN